MIFSQTYNGARSFTQLEKIVSFGFMEGLARCLNWPIMLLLPLFVTNSEEYGMIGLLVATEAIAAGVFLLGQDRSILRFYASEKDRSGFLRTILVLWGAVSVVSILVLCLAGSVFRGKMFGVPVYPHLTVLFFAIALLNLNTLCVNISRVSSSLPHFALFRIGFQAIKFTMVLGATYFLKSSFGYVTGLAFALLVLSVWIVPFLFRRSMGSFKKETAVHLALFGWPFVFHIVSVCLLSHISRFMLQALTTLQDVALYTFAFTIGSCVYLFYAALSTYFEPQIYKFSHDKGRSEKWLGYYGMITTSVAAGFGVVLLFFFPLIISRFYPDYGEAASIIPIILASVLLRPIYLQGNYRLVVYEKTTVIASGTLLAVIVNVLLNVFLIPGFGIRGAAIALFLSNLFLSLYLYGISLRVDKIQRKHIVGLAPFTITLVVSIGIAVSNTAWISILLLSLMLLTSFGCFVWHLSLHRTGGLVVSGNS